MNKNEEILINIDIFSKSPKIAQHCWLRMHRR
jgi:hypothetical protein